MSIQKISVCMLCYNHEQYVAKSINSIISNQSDQYELEVIIIDDGSTDGTVQRISDIINQNTSDVSIKLYSQAHEGPHSIAKNFNKLIAISSGKYISFLSSDDIYTKDRFQAQYSIMERDPNVVACYADGYQAKKGSIQKKVNSSYEAHILQSNRPHDVLEYIKNNVPNIFIQSILVRRDILNMYKPFDESLIADDWVFNIRLFEIITKYNMQYRYVPTPLFIRNIHNNNTSRNIELQYERECQVAEKYGLHSDILFVKILLSTIVHALRSHQYKIALDYMRVYLRAKKMARGTYEWILLTVTHILAEHFHRSVLTVATISAVGLQVV